MIRNIAIHQAAVEYCKSLPYSQALGVKHVCSPSGEDIFSVTWREDLVTSPDNPSLHNGVIVALIDVAGGVAVSRALQEVEAVVTLDMRIDYPMSALANQNVHAVAECLRIEKQIALVKIVCFHDCIDEPIALGTATYMCTPVPKELIEKFL